jgi:hypothetical protein
MTWRDNDLALEALAVQGYYDEDTNTLQQDTLAGALRDVFLRKPVRASQEDILDRKARFLTIGLSKTQLLDAIFPGFRERHMLSEDERVLLKKAPKDHPQLEERSKAITDLTTLLWGTLGKTSRSGGVQKLLVTQGLLLVETKAARDDVSVPVKAATDDQDLIIEWYVRPRGDQLVKVSGGVRDDCTMVGMTFEGINERMKRELGGSVTSAVANLLQVATPDLSALTAPAKTSKAIAPGPAKS